jgi:glycerol uptake facilitator-like aquaporin
MRAALAEFVATCLLLTVVVGVATMSSRLGGGEALSLLACALTTAGMLVVLILVFGPVSGAHMNPAVTFAEAAVGGLPWRRVPGYVLAQVTGAFAGVALAHAMYELPPFTASTQARSGMALGLGETVATFALVLVVLVVARRRPTAVPGAVGAVVGAGYWYTSSTSFANPAVALARAATTTPAGIRFEDVPGFVAGEAIGTLAAVLTFVLLVRPVLEPTRD